MFIQCPRPQRIFTALLLSTALSSNFAFAQTPQNELLDEIIVTGSPLSATTGENLVGVSVIGGEELAHNLSGSLGETLKKVPGLSSTFFGPGASRPVIRGQGGARIRILDNGIGSIDAASASPDHATSVEPAMASRIEIIRGSGLLRYGSSASGGVINVIDGRIPDSIPDKSISGAMRVGASSVDDGYEGSLGVNFRLGDMGSGTWIGHLDASTRKTKNYSIPGLAESAVLHVSEGGSDAERDEEEAEATGVLENSATHSRALSAGLSWIGQATFVGLAVRNLDSEYGIPGGNGHDEEDEEGGVTIDLKQTRIDGIARFELGGLFEKLTINGGYGDYTHTEFEPDGAVGTVFANEGFELRTELVQAERGNWRAAYGAQVQNRDFSAIGEEAFVPPTSSVQIGLFTFQELEMGDWHFEGGVRYEHNSHDNDTADISRSFNSFSLSAGADYHLTETTRLGGTVFRTSRAPTSEELFSNGPHLATNQFELGDLSLGNEIAAGGEISLRFRKNRSYTSVNLFTTNYSGYIYERATGAQEDGLPVLRFTASDAVFKGFEVEAGARLAKHKGFDVLADIAIEYVDANLGSGGGALPRIPPLSVVLGLALENDDWKLRAELDHAVKQDDVAPGELETDAYTLVNFQASYRINESITARGSVNNIFNDDARQHTSFLKDVVPLPGRNFKISFVATF